MASIDAITPENSFKEGVVVRHLGWRVACPREGSRVLAKQPHAVFRDERTVLAKEHEGGDRLDLKQLAQLFWPPAAVRQRWERHVRAIAIEAPLHIVEARQYDLYFLAVGTETIIDVYDLRGDLLAARAPISRAGGPRVELRTFNAREACRKGERRVAPVPAFDSRASQVDANDL